MKKTLLQRLAAVFLIFTLIFTALPFMGGFDAHAAAPSQKQVYNKLISMKEKYPEGKRWTNNNSYHNDYAIGYGCAAFAFAMSDAAFGKEPPYTTHNDLSELKTGDILRINNDTHSVVVLKVKKKYVIIAEGNYNGRIHWNRKLSIKDLKKDKKLSILTRYYWQDLNFEAAGESVRLSWSKLTKSQRKKISGIAIVRNGKVIKKLKNTATSYSDADVNVYRDYTYQLKTYKKVKKSVTLYWNKKTGKWQEKKIKNVKTKTVRKTKIKYSHESPVAEFYFVFDDYF